MNTTSWILTLIVCSISFFCIGYFLWSIIKLIENKKNKTINLKEISKTQKKIWELKSNAQIEIQKKLDLQKRELDLKYKTNFEELNLKYETKLKELQLQKNQLQKESSAYKKIEKEVEKKNQELFSKISKVHSQREILENKIWKLNTELSRISKLSVEDAKSELLQKLDKQLTHEKGNYLKKYKNETEKSAKQISQDIIFQAIEKYSTEIITDKVSNIVELPNDEMKGRIIGKEGRNIKTFEKYAGVDVIVDDRPNIVSISCFNPIRREIATQTLKKLLKDGRIQPIRIEETLIEVKNEINEIIENTANEVLNELEIYNIDKKIKILIGKLKYRTSFYQNVLSHSIEVAKLSAVMAAELKLDIDIAKRAGLLHDIGKAMTFENEGSHVDLGVKIATECNENDYIINAIASHHGDIKPNNPYAIIVAAADTLSAARPGARSDSLENYIARISKLEELCNNIKGVKETYVLEAGRKIQVIVNSNDISDDKCLVLADQVKSIIKKNKTIPGDIHVTVLREFKIKRKII